MPNQILATQNKSDTAPCGDFSSQRRLLEQPGVVTAHHRLDLLGAEVAVSEHGVVAQQW